MEILLVENVINLGSRGDVVNVKDGYARNYLLPKNLAREATAGNLKSVEQERKKWALLASKEKEQAEKAASAVKGTKIVVRKRVGESGQLFGSVTTNEIADALTGKGFDVDKRRIELGHPIKTLGVHDVEVRLHKDVMAQIQVEVVPIGVEKLEEPEAKPEPETEAAQQQ